MSRKDASRYVSRKYDPTRPPPGPAPSRPVDRFKNLPVEIIQKIAMELPPTGLISTCQTSKRMKQVICDDERFWRTKLNADFPGVMVNRNDTAKLTYLRLVEICDKFPVLMQKHLEMVDLLELPPPETIGDLFARDLHGRVDEMTSALYVPMRNEQNNPDAVRRYWNSGVPIKLHHLRELPEYDQLRARLTIDMPEAIVLHKLLISHFILEDVVGHYLIDETDAQPISCENIYRLYEAAKQISGAQPEERLFQRAIYSERVDRVRPLSLHEQARAKMYIMTQPQYRPELSPEDADIIRRYTEMHRRRRF